MKERFSIPRFKSGEMIAGTEKMFLDALARDLPEFQKNAGATPEQMKQVANELYKMSPTLDEFCQAKRESVSDAPTIKDLKLPTTKEDKDD